MKAMVIDDSRAIRMVLSRILKSIGFEEVCEAEHGKAAIEILEKEGPVDLALVDWNMPEMNGLEFVQAARAISAYDDMKLVMVTTETEMSRMITALEAGANEYVMKPFTKEVLIDKLAIIGIEVE